MSDPTQPEAPAAQTPDQPESGGAPPPREEAPAPAEASKPAADAPPGSPADAPPERVWPAWLPLAVAAAVPALFFLFLPPLTTSGLWDPYELNVADLSRRVALNLYHAADLALGGADNSLPHLNDLGRPQLPFSSIALGFKIFGLHEWAGRLPLALWGLLGVLATYAFVARLFDRRTGVFASIALSTMPLYFVQARSMLGDVCTMAGLAMAFGGLAVAAFDRDEKGPTAPIQRLRWLGMAAVGLFVGFESRGALIGLGVPLLAIGLSWAVGRVAAARSRPDLAGDAVGAVSLLAGVGVAAMVARVVAGSDSKDLNLWVGSVLHNPAKYPTFDVYVGSIGHALAPWSAFLPFAFGRLLMAPPEREGAAGERESLARMAVLVGAAVALVAHGFVAARTDLVAFSGPALCAVACAVAIRDFERGARASIAVGVGTLIIAAVFHHDFHELPEKAYQAFGITGATFPEGFKARALDLWWVVLGGFAVCAFLTWIERGAERDPFDPATYRKVLRLLREAWDGMLALLYFAFVAGTSLAGLGVWIGLRTHASFVHSMQSNLKEGILNAWWIVAFVPLGLILGLLFASDVWLWAFDRSKPLSRASLTRGFEPFEGVVKKLFPAEGDPRLESGDLLTVALVLVPLLLGQLFAVGFALHVAGANIWVSLLAPPPLVVGFYLALGLVGDTLRHRAPALALGGLVVGFVLCFSYYPALANQLSPKEVFESYRNICPGSPLALLGVGGRTSAYYAGGQPQTLTDPSSAQAWLAAAAPGQRRCLAMKAEELPKLNQLWREHADPKGNNLPVVDARSSQILLAASSLSGGEKNENPLNAVVLSAPPKPQRRLDVNMDDKLEVIGIDMLDERGRPVEGVNPGRTYHLKTYYKVLAPVTTEWEAFIHIDGYHRRHNGDHKPMNGKYAMNLWLPGDMLVDDHEFKLEPNFTPGTYTIYFGLFVGDTRLKVKSGPSDGDNRINGGALHVL
jgi:4-amino-4-deoxy-L-arabinose transferase-like glycosyltransferase